MYLLKAKKTVWFTCLCIMYSMFGLSTLSATDDSLGTTSFVLNTNVVSFEPIVLSTTGHETKFTSTSTIDFGNVVLDQTLPSITKDLYVVTNNYAGISLTLSDSSGRNGALHETTSTDTIATTYKIQNGVGASFDTVTIGTPVTLTSVVDYSGKTASTRKLVIEPSQALDRTSGTYTTSLVMTVTAL